MTMTVKELIKMMDRNTMIKDGVKFVTREEYAKKYGNKFVHGFWAIDKEKVGIFAEHEKEYKITMETVEKIKKGLDF